MADGMLVLLVEERDRSGAWLSLIDEAGRRVSRACQADYDQLRLARFDLLSWYRQDLVADMAHEEIVDTLRSNFGGGL